MGKQQTCFAERCHIHTRLQPAINSEQLLGQSFTSLLWGKNTSMISTFAFS
jgi:hypothetical protein